jgi:hypothetical protein
MADRIIKGDSGNDVIIQNNDASRKIEVTNSGDVEVTGDVKTTTVKATNLKANDGTAGLSIADSTGRITANEKILVDDIIEKTSDHGVEIDGVLIKDSEMASGAINSAVTMSANQACVKTALNASGSAPIYACRAWCSFVGTGTPSINASGNVSSLDDHGTGQIQVNFTTSLPDVNYVTAGSCGNDTDSSTVHAVMFGESSARTASSVRFTTMKVSGSSGTLADESIVNIACFR